MQRKRPAQRRTSSRSVVKTKSRSFVPTRGSRTATTNTSAKRSWFSKRKKPSTNTTRTTSKSSNTFSSWIQTMIVWLILIVIGGWVIWYIVLWGIVPKLLSPQQSSTVAILPTQAGGKVLVVQIESDLKDSKVFILDGEETVTLPGEYGQYRLSAIYPLLLIDAKDERYFKGTLNRVFGIFIDSEILVEGPLSSDIRELRAQLNSQFWNSIVSDKKISLHLLRTWYILQYNNTVNDSLSVQTLVDKIRMANGGTFATRDECRVAILNSTSTPGLAGGLADIVERNGGIVIRLGQYSEMLESSTLLYDPNVAECQEAMEQIKTLSPVPFEVAEDTTVQGKFRAPLVAIIGKNFE